jgi:Carboxypeptidase regulatory-like domain
MSITLRFAVALLCGVTLAAQTPPPQTKKEKREAATERVVEGRITDTDDKPVNGAVVQLKDMRTLQVRSFITQTNGEYHFSGLKIDNDYELKSDYNGMTSGWKTLSVFDTRKEPVINLKLAKAADKGDKGEKK